MATLNVKNLLNALYRELTARAKRERRSVAQEITILLEQALEPAAPLSILELRGLGKELWHGLDGASHVERERGAWRRSPFSAGNHRCGVSLSLRSAIVGNKI